MQQEGRIEEDPGANPAGARAGEDELARLLAGDPDELRTSLIMLFVNALNGATDDEMTAILGAVRSSVGLEVVRATLNRMLGVGARTRATAPASPADPQTRPRIRRSGSFDAANERLADEFDAKQHAAEAQQPSYQPPDIGAVLAPRQAIYFSPEATQTLTELAKERGVTPEEVVHDAVQLLIWIEEAKAQGYHVLLERKGRVRELVTP